jgi:hypothetical protein
VCVLEQLTVCSPLATCRPWLLAMGHGGAAYSGPTGKGTGNLGRSKRPILPFRTTSISLIILFGFFASTIIPSSSLLAHPPTLFLSSLPSFIRFDPLFPILFFLLIRHPSRRLPSHLASTEAIARSKTHIWSSALWIRSRSTSSIP